MPLQTIEINSVKITFDKEKTNEYRTSFNQPCDCQWCRNYYKHIENNTELLGFLESFGVDYRYAEEIVSYDLEDKNDGLIYHEGSYGVFGNIDNEICFEKFGVKVSFLKSATAPCDREDAYFWICIEGDFPYILD